MEVMCLYMLPDSGVSLFQIRLYDCCTEIYIDGHAVLMFALFFLNVFSLLALTFVAVTIFRSVYNCDVVSQCAMSHGI